MSNPNELLMGAECEARESFQAALQQWRHADRLPGFDSLAVVEADKLTIVVLYHPERHYRYEFTDCLEDGLHGRFDNRESCLSALGAVRS